MYAGDKMNWETYWQDRKHLAYYQTVKTWLEQLGKQESILDIGCAGVPTATFGDFQRRVAINKEPFPLIDNIENIVDDWLLYDSDVFSVITCMQVLEHFEQSI